MDVILQNKLFTKYPNLFHQRTLPPSESPLSRGIECGNGWYELIDKTCEKLKALKGKKHKNMQFCQVKEKFGGLRLYMDYDTDEAYEICRVAEIQSYRICEECGQAGTTNKDGWLRTLCNKCRK